MRATTILVVGTYDTKNDELGYIAEKITELGGATLSMDISVLGDPATPVDVSKHDVAGAAGSTIQAVIDSGDENTAMQIMASGASTLARRLYDDNRFDGVLILGGTMGTDAALDICQALPLGVPKYVVSTVSFSPIIPAERLSADIQMILWAGGLYGLNSVCKSSLSQAAGAVLGAAQAVEKPRYERPIVGMTSFGSSCLTYMKTLKPELEKRGFEVAIFHATGMGGMAFESIAREGGFACVMDFAPQELGNLMAGSVINGGADRLTNAGRAAIPQIVAPGCLDLIDFPGAQVLPDRFADRPFHAHNRLLKSSVWTGPERRDVVRELAKRLRTAQGPVHVLLPNQGVEEWDRTGGDTHDPAALSEMCDEMRRQITAPLALTELDCHINDRAFADAALSVFDAWLAEGKIAKMPQ